ncbi:hypothetical protein ES704_03008 [subsurface metagenome]|jgi:antitoxin component YwqK of YwqJK toxin-antitoxin module
MSKNETKTQKEDFSKIFGDLKKYYEESKVNGFEYALASDVILYKPAHDKKNNKPVVSFECKLDGKIKKYAISGEIAITKIFSTFNKEDRTIQAPINCANPRSMKVDEVSNTIWVYS